MSDKQNDSSDNKSATPRTLDDQDIKTNRLNGRRAFLGTIGISFLGATAIAIGSNLSSARAADSDGKDKKASDFPKGSSDTNTTENKDLKAVDSDSHNSKAVDSNQNRLRDVKRSADSD